MSKEVKCIYCNYYLTNINCKRHIQEKHNDLSNIEKAKLYNMCVVRKDATITMFVDEFLERMFKIYDTFEDYLKVYISVLNKFNRFVEAILKYKELPENIIDKFFDVYLPYKNAHPGVTNSYRLAELYTETPEEAKEYYEKIIKPRNPYTGHGAELSPWCKEFVGYKNLTGEERDKMIISKTFNNKREDADKLNNSCTLKYYLNKGLSEAEARQALKERQTTFSLARCIEKFGEEEGIKRFNERQEKWLTSLNTPENIEILKRARVNSFIKQAKKHYSKISQQLFDAIVNKVHKNLSYYYATSSLGEYVVTTNSTKAPMLDFYISEYNIWIEFDGEFWHSKIKDIQAKDKAREELVKIHKQGIHLKRIKERDYRENPEKILIECVEWINGIIKEKEYEKR